MEKHLGQIILNGILLSYVLSAWGNSDHKSGVTEKSLEKTAEYEESGEIFALQLQDNYQNSFLQLLQFVQATNSALAKLNDRLERLEWKQNNLEQTTAAIQHNLSTHTIGISTLQSEIGTLQGIVYVRNPDDFLNLLPVSMEGKSFNGTSFESIVRALPEDYSLAVQIKNYMDNNLTDYSLYLKYGLKHSSAPTTIPGTTTEVITFIRGKWGPEGVLRYHIGGSNISLHLYFVCNSGYRTFAAAFLPNATPVETIEAYTCTQYIHSGTVGTHECISSVPWDTISRIRVHDTVFNIFAIITFQPKWSTQFTLTAQVFKVPF